MTPTRVRIGDAERDSAVSALGEHFAAGRLTREEFDERADRAWAAKSAEDLDPLFTDLPRERSPSAVTPVPAGPVRRRGRLPRFAFALLAVAVVITIMANLPIVLMVLGILWFTGMIGHRGRAHRGWSHAESFGCRPGSWPSGSSR